jgi:hypothetical protein
MILKISFSSIERLAWISTSSTILTGVYSRIITTSGDGGRGSGDAGSGDGGSGSGVATLGSGVFGLTSLTSNYARLNVALSSVLNLGTGLVLLLLILASLILKFFLTSSRFLTDSLAILLLARPPIFRVLPTERLLLTESISDYFLDRDIC